MFKSILAITLASFTVSAADSYKEVKPHSGISALVASCEAATSEIRDFALCPRIQKYEVASKAAFKNLVENEFGFKLKASTAVKAAEAIARSMDGHADNYREYLEHADGASSNKLLYVYLKYEVKFQNLIESMGKNKKVYVDLDTYWEPSVNAKAVVIYNEEQGTAYVIIHGDTDG